MFSQVVAMVGVENNNFSRYRDIVTLATDRYLAMNLETVVQF
jgi:hypothetical protein